jgi:hypothetical protein
MKTFNAYLIEQKNTHMEHIEELMFNEGVNGTRKAINFLRDLRDMLAGHSKNSITRTVKWDGAPAVFAGVDPTDGKFFVAKKGVFNKNSKIYKTPEDVKADTSGDLQAKLLIALDEFSKLGIKKGMYQGDLMFTKGDISKEKIDGEEYFTFQPNTIVYAVPAKSSLGRMISRARIGIVWHTVYTGDKIESMSASFGKDIVNKFKQTSSIWQADATYRDLSGRATFTDSETKQVTQLISTAGKLFNKVPASLLNAFKDNNELLIRVKAFNNTFIKAGKRIDPKTHMKLMFDSMFEYYKNEIDKKKTQKSKDEWIEKRKNIMKVFSSHSKAEFENLFTLLNTIVDAKQMIVDKMNEASEIGTFIRTKSGFTVTNQEGFVAIDHMSGGAVKIIDRMEFSRANFSPDVIKGWQR